MKKSFLSFLLMCMSVISTFAQGSMVATLHHESTVKTFYGASGLHDAHAAAADGDVITLSSGSFLSVDITKAITLRGAGMVADTNKGVLPTVINGDFNITIPQESTHKLTIEGLYVNGELTSNCQLNGATFLKSIFKNISHSSDGSNNFTNLNIINCRIYDMYCFNGSTISAINSMIKDPSTNISSEKSFYEFVNCIVLDPSVGSAASFKNCIIKENSSLSQGVTAYNCIGIGVPDIFYFMTNSSNQFVDDYSKIFKTYKGEDLEKNDNENFELTEEAAAKYLGVDGKQVGVYGGPMPFDATPSNPQITKCNVASKSTADGKLSVDIQINTAE